MHAFLSPNGIVLRAVNKFGRDNRPELLRSKSSAASPQSKATLAVVTINLSIEGDSTRLPAVRDRKDVRNALSKLASDAQVGDCLLAGEVLWAPAERTESLSQEDIFADYPHLVPL
jgi:uncharacterized membrane protein